MTVEILTEDVYQEGEDEIANTYNSAEEARDALLKEIFQ